MAYGFALFETSIGACGVVWGAKGLLGLQLPETDEAKTRARVLRRWPQAREIGRASCRERVYGLV